MTPGAASTRTRFTGAALALLLQLGFIAAFLHAFSTQAPPQQLAHELTFFLPRLLAKPAPVATARPVPSAPLNIPDFTPPLMPFAPAPPVANAAPAGLPNFGRALFGCVPENYASLTPQQRALCSGSGLGIAAQEAPDLMHSLKPAQDEAYWKEKLRQKQAPKLLFGLGGAYPAEKPMSRDEAEVEEMTTWDPCPVIANAPCLYNAAHGYAQPGAAGAPPSIRGVKLHAQ